MLWIVAVAAGGLALVVFHRGELRPVQVSAVSVAVTVPGTPSAVAAAPGNTAAVVRWISPSSDGGSPLTGYVVTPYLAGVAQAPRVFASTATTQTVTALVNGKTYTFKVAAKNVTGTGPQSTASVSIIVGAPVAPTGVSVTPGNTTAAVKWVAPSTNNGSAITAYVVTPYVSGMAQSPHTFVSTATAQNVTGLTNGIVYTFEVAAKNGIGTGPASAPTLPLTVGAPLPPTAVIATPGLATAATGPLSVSFVAGANNGSLIMSFTAACTSGNGGVTGTTSGTSGPVTVTGLTTSKTYTCTVKATNANGGSASSVPSPAVIIGAPARPIAVHAVSGSTATTTGPLSVSFAPGANNGSAITSFTTTCTSGNGGLTGTMSGASGPLTVTGLTTAKTYTCTVKATNANGSSASSAPSPTVIVGVPALPTRVTLTNVPSGQAQVSFTAGADNGSAITTFTAICTSTNGGLIGSHAAGASPILVSGLTTTLTYTYTCTVTATNARGTGPASAPSPSVVKFGALDHLVVSPASASITAGGSQPYTAAGFDQFSNSLGDVTGASTFTVIADGSCAGAICTANLAGSHAIAATDGTASGTATLTVAPKLDFVGDSITAQSVPDIHAHYDAAHAVHISAFIGADTYLSTGNVAADAASPPPVEVINLGTNDAARLGTGNPGDPVQTIDSIDARLDSFNAEFPSITCVVFVTVNTHNPSWEPAAGQAINAHIRSTFRHVVDWDAAWQATYFDVPDNPHPNETGRQALLTLEDPALAACARQRASLVVSPASATIGAGGSQAYTAEGFDKFNNSLGDVTGASTFTISPDGSCTGATCTANQAGLHTVTATDGTATGTSTLTVNAGPLDHLVVSPASATISAGGTQAYMAEGFDQYNNDLGDMTGASMFTIGPDGSCTAATCTATAAGSDTVTATDGTATGTATLTFT